MAVYRFESDIAEDHRLQIPADVPVGPAQIVVIPHVSDEGKGARFRAMVREMAKGPYHTRTKEEIDAALRHERESWE